MNNKSLLILCPLLLILTACGNPGSEPPVAGSVPTKKAPAKRTAANKAPAAPTAKKPASTPDTATYAIEGVSNNFKDEPNLPTFRAEPLMPPADIPPPAAPASPAALAPAAVATTPAPVPKFVIEDARIPSGTPPAVVALISESDRSRNGGDLDAAVVVMERALRIDSRNPTLTYKLAQLRIKQNKPQLAEELAGKAALLAGGDLDLKRKSWLLIAEARQMQQNSQGAKEAKAKADSFFGR
ncbi:tetratricopeptide repeat protein [Methylomonas albis]|uniref:Tetratricopeptide repeat protein n=1 Tax=Methylomonas albis TaxID=1854563 RepID=A0ABR9CYC2_9GAMM|nr:tetratricopeptide repeat protein [Methylomonas albis]MBD9355690.1 tetratricopeptide repeat protein [Methylomonas albis]